MDNNNLNRTASCIRLLCGTGLSLSLLLAGCGIVPKQTDRERISQEIAMPVPQQTDGTIYQSSYGLVLFEDIKARDVGDILTVRLVERTQGQKAAATSTEKDSTTSIPGPTILGRPVTYHGTEILETELASSHDFEGEGDSSQSNSLTGTIAVTVVKVLPNGNLRVEGEKQVEINQGTEYIRLSGIVRPADIETNNTIPSDKVASAVITYTGDGAIGDANSQGWLSRFFLSPFFPF